MARYTGSGNDPNLDALGAFGLSLIPGMGSNQGANFTNGQHSPRMTTRTMVTNLTVGGNQGTSRSATPSPSRNVQYVGSSEINIADNVTLTGNNIIAGAGIVDMRTGGKGPKKEPSDDDDLVDGGSNMPASKITIGDNVTFNAGNSIIIGAQYVRIDNIIGDKEVKRRFHDLMGDKWDGNLNVFSDESKESAERTVKEVIRQNPLVVLKVCSSICLILWEGGNSVGTGFLARVKGFEDIVLLTAGHNFPPGKDFSGHILYFKAMDGDENGKGVLEIPFTNIACRKFSFVSTCKGKRYIANQKAEDNLNHKIQSNKKGDDINPDLDYCLITLPGWDGKFIEENHLETLEVKEQELNADRLCYVGHPYMGFNLGTYEHADAAASDNDEHYAELKPINEDEGTYEWSNNKGEKWRLYTTGEQDTLRVGEECPHFANYKEAKFIRTKQNGVVRVVLLGPDEQPFCFKPSRDAKDTKLSKALRFSYGSKKVVEDIKIKYTLDTKGGASGSPVLGDDYTVTAIHTFWSNSEKISGGIKITEVMEDLRKVKETHPNFFTDEKEDDFKIAKKTEGCHWCSAPNRCPNLVEILEDQDRIPELEKAKEIGCCARLHLKPEEITNLLTLKDKILK